MSCEGGAADGRGGRTEEEKWRDPSEKQEPHTVMWGNMSSSVGMMKIPTYGKIKAMFQTINQYWKGHSKKSPRICQFWWKNQHSHAVHEFIGGVPVALPGPKIPGKSSHFVTG